MKIFIILLASTMVVFGRQLPGAHFLPSGPYIPTIVDAWRDKEIQARARQQMALNLYNAAKGEFRIINGKTNSVLLDPDFVTFAGTVLQVQADGIRVKGFYKPLRGGPSHESEFFVDRYPFETVEDQSIGRTVYLFAKNVGTYTYTTVLGASRTIRKLDYGKEWTPPPPSTEELAAAKAKVDAHNKAALDKALQWNLSQAEKGDAFGQFRMGQRYLIGEGVEKNIDKAKEWFSKAAAQGHKDAISELSKLSSQSSSEALADTSSK